MRLKLEDVEFDPGSVVDPAGKVFHYDGRIFRAITEEYADIYREFFKKKDTQNIFDAGLVDTWVSDIELDGFKLVLEHLKVPILSSWSEWCSYMLKDATLMVAELNLALAKLGYVTKDTQPGNVQFINGKPVWIDFGSIAPIQSHGNFHFDEFRYHSLLPLKLWSRNYSELGKAIYKEVGKGYLKALSNKKPFKWYPVKFWQIKRDARTQNNSIESLERLCDYIRNLELSPIQGFWTSYGQGGMPDVTQPETFNEKAGAVYELLKVMPHGTLLDMAGNKGWYAELAVSLGHQAISFDIDDASVCYLYQRIKANHLPILPLVQNFLYPTPPYSIGLGKLSSFERLQADTVLALAIVHHLVFKQHVYFEPIIDIIAKYTRQQAIIEFVPKEDIYVSQWYEPKYSWYTLDNFMNVAKRRFSNIEVYDSSPSPRKLLLCYK